MTKTLAIAVAACVCAAAAFAQTAASESDDAKRERELKIPEIVRVMDLRPGSRVADVGAGDGFYEMALSRAVGPEGHVYAEDISDKYAMKEIRERIEKHHLQNVEPVLGTADDPKMPPGLDAVLTVISYHEYTNPQKMLERIRAALKPGGRFVVVDMMPHRTIDRPRAVQAKNHVFAPALAETEIRQAGFEVVSRDDRFIDDPDEESSRWIMVFRKP